MKNSFTLSLLILFFFTSWQLPAGVIDSSLVHNDSLRTYKLYVPEAYTGEEEWPLVIALHGYTLSAEIMMAASGMNAVADTGHFLVVYPQALTVQFDLSIPPLPPSATGWNLGAVQHSNNDDVDFISQLIDEINGYKNIDLNQVYACGLSNGGFMVNKLVCELSDRIAAGASVSALLPRNFVFPCAPVRPVPMLYMNGTADPIIPFTGIPHIAHSAETSIDFWLAHNNCEGVATETLLPDLVTEDSCTVTVHSYLGCPDSSAVMFYRIENGGHDWPGSPFPSPPFLGFTNQDINASIEIWNFFRNKYLVTPTDLEEPQPTLMTVSPNPFSQSITIELDLPKTSEIQLQLFNNLGQLVGVNQTQRFPSGPQHIRWDINDATLLNGIYFVQITIDGEQLVRPVIFQAN